MKVLVTGFEPNDDGINASQRVVESLRDDFSSGLHTLPAAFEFRIMPGNTNSLGLVVDEALDSIGPDICIGIGQSNYNKITLELLAKNIRHFATPDRAGNAPKWESIVDDAPAAYLTTLHDTKGLCSFLESHGIPARLSADCGTHLCNQALYHFLHWRGVHNSEMRTGFVHIPVLPEQIMEHRPEFPCMPLELTVKAVSLIISNQVKSVHEML